MNKHFNKKITALLLFPSLFFFIFVIPLYQSFLVKPNFPDNSQSLAKLYILVFLILINLIVLVRHFIPLRWYVFYLIGSGIVMGIIAVVAAQDTSEWRVFGTGFYNIALLFLFIQALWVWSMSKIEQRYLSKKKKSKKSK